MSEIDVSDQLNSASISELKTMGSVFQFFPSEESCAYT